MLRTICLFVALILASPAGAVPVCGERQVFIDRMASTYGERVVGIGVAGQGEAVMELLVSKSGSWTLLRTVASGMACVIAVGNGWERLALDLGDKL